MLTNSSKDGLQQPHDEMSTMTLPKKDGTIESAANLVENGQTDLASLTEESKMVASPKFNQAMHKIGSFLEERRSRWNSPGLAKIVARSLSQRWTSGTSLKTLSLSSHLKLSLQLRVRMTIFIACSSGARSKNSMSSH